MTGLAVNRVGLGHKLEDGSQRRNPRILFASLAAAGALNLGGCSINRERSCDFDLGSGQTHFVQNTAKHPTIDGDHHFQFVVDVSSVSVNGRNCTVNATLAASYCDSTRVTLRCDQTSSHSLISTSLTLRPEVVRNANGNGSHVVIHATYVGSE